MVVVERSGVWGLGVFAGQLRSVGRNHNLKSLCSPIRFGGTDRIGCATILKRKFEFL